MAVYNETISGGGFHHVALRVKDFDASVKFYTEGLGFNKSMSWGEGDKRAVMLDTGDGSYFELFAGGTDGEKPEGAFIHVALRTDDCDLAFKRAIEAGAKVKSEPVDVTIASDPPTPVRIAFCKGPDGEEIEFFQRK